MEFIKFFITILALSAVLYGCSNNNNSPSKTESPMTNAEDKMKDTADDIGNGVGNAVKDTGDMVGDTVNDIGKGVGDVTKDAGNTVKDIAK